ncbi:hypothetical protein GO003_001075 [Methylicorpusculum oleiharenae]|uniref:hypothetical protein n=1 Tax=Methylicorpusculum oleiharenae TaxID=1338687 RepID=UPI00135C284B|nr:hypothetical protein [Methylicorpusculum oleiharenae]MCD2448988.1 hypothetical protein [Methylicorpusculum oleiharenae]
MMNRTILIPTDFSVGSLNLVKQTIDSSNNNTLHFVLTHCLFLPDEPGELLYFSKTELIRSLKSREFNRACKTIRERYPAEKMRITSELFTGLNQTAFNHFIDANQIDEAVIPKQYQPTLNLKSSFNPLPFIRKSRLKITEITVSEHSDLTIKNNLERLANSFIRA